MKISVIVCTYKREDYLRLALESLLHQKTEDLFDYEILVVDNSPDATAASVAKAFSSGRVKYIHEEKTGLSFARNRGIKESKADIIAFIDDDAVADSNWLYELHRVYREHEDAVCVGGKIGLIFHGNVDISWLPDDFLIYIGLVDFGENCKYARDHTEYPTGSNISFKRSVFDKVGLFNTSFGRKGSSLLSCEDSELCLKIQRNMPLNKIYYSPKAFVRHNVLEERLTREWFLKRLYWQGRSESLFDMHAFGISSIRRRIRNNIVSIIPSYFRKLFHFRVAKDPKLLFYSKAMIVKEIGYIQQSYHLFFCGR